MTEAGRRYALARKNERDLQMRKLANGIFDTSVTEGRC